MYLVEHRYCDICNRSELELSSVSDADSPVIASDEDGLWVCSDCSDNLIQPAVGSGIAEESELGKLVGKSAGAICHTLNLPYEPPYRSVIDAAAKIAYDEDRYMSAWSFVTQWTDGTTIWRSEAEDEVATVGPEGSIQIRSVY